MTELNLNDHIWLKLTDKGRAVLHAHYADRPELLQYIETKDGWTKLLLWHAMNVFGPSMGIGFDLVCETTIRVEAAV